MFGKDKWIELKMLTIFLNLFLLVVTNFGQPMNDDCVAKGGEMEIDKEVTNKWHIGHQKGSKGYQQWPKQKVSYLPTFASPFCGTFKWVIMSRLWLIMMRLT